MPRAWQITYLGAIALAGNRNGPILFSSPFTEVVRNFGDPQQEIADSGGFRQTIDGWARENVPANITTAEELSRNNLTPLQAGRFRALRTGSVTGVIVTSTKDCHAGTLTVEVYKNTGLAGAGAGGSGTGLTAQLNSTTAIQRAVTPAAANVYEFLPGDELYITVKTSSDWAPTSSDIRCALEIED